MRPRAVAQRDRAAALGGRAPHDVGDAQLGAAREGETHAASSSSRAARNSAIASSTAGSSVG